MTRHNTLAMGAERGKRGKKSDEKRWMAASNRKKHSGRERSAVLGRGPTASTLRHPHLTSAEPLRCAEVCLVRLRR